jgi:GT2 family glycosyltransferase
VETTTPRISVVIPFYIAGPAEKPGRYQGTLGPWSGAPALGDAQRVRLRHLRLMLASLSVQTLPVDEFEVLVIDDGSDLDGRPDAEQWAGDWPQGLRLRWIRKDHEGFCSGYNRGIEEARAPLVYLAVDHDILGPDTLRAHVDQHAETGRDAVVSGWQRYLFHSILFKDVTDPSAGLTDVRNLAMLPGLGWLPDGVRHLGLDRKPVTVEDVLHSFDRVECWASSTAEYDDVARVIRGGLVSKLRCGWLAMRTGSNTVPVELLRRIGGFDARLDDHFGWYAEYDLGLRLFQAGASFVFTEQAVAVDLFHGPPPETGIGKSTALAYLMGKHGTVDVALLPHYVDRVLDIEQYSMHAEAAQEWWTGGSRQ